MGNKIDISLFLERADLLKNSSYFNEPREISFKLKYKRSEGGGSVTQKKPASREQLESFFIRVRPFLVKNEPVSTKAVIDYLLKKHIDNVDLVELEKYKKIYLELEHGALMVIRTTNKVGEVKEYTPYQMMWEYLYSDYFHLDTNKRKHMDEFKGILGPIIETMALVKLENFALLTLNLAAYIRKTRPTCLLDNV